MNDYFIIHSLGHEKLKIIALFKIWAKTYNISHFSLEIFEKSEQEIFIRMKKSESDVLYFYLLNFLQYPESEKSDLVVKGYLRSTDKSILGGKQILIYNDIDDIEGDNIYCVTETNENYKIVFDSKIFRVKDTMKFYEINIPTVPCDVIDVTINSRNNDKFQDGDNKLITYLKWLSIVLLSFYVIIILFPSNKQIQSVFFFFGFLPGIWYMTDTKMLMKYSNYIKLLIFSLVIFSLNFILFVFAKVGTEALYSGLAPLTLLIFQRPLRNIYLRIFKHEPKTGLFGVSVPEFTYSMLLFISLMLMPIPLYEFIVYFFKQ